MKLKELLGQTHSKYWRNTKSSYCNAKKAVAYFGEDYDAYSFTKKEIAGYLEHLQGKGYTNNTINHKMAALSKMITHLTEIDEEFTAPPVPSVKPNKSRDFSFTREMEEQLIAKFIEHGHDVYADVVVMMADVGLRFGELIKISKIHDRGDHISLTSEITKTDEPANIPLTSRAQEVMARYKDKDYFQHLNYRKGWYPSFIKARNELGYGDIKEFVPHRGRHTFCTRLVEGGVDPFTAMRLMRHSDIKTTLGYYHNSMPQKRKAISVLE